MSRNAIVVGDRHSGGGSVVSGSSFADIHGKPIARVKDMAVCVKHKGPFAIVTGDPTLIVDGQPIARHGDYLACGCRLLSSQQNTLFIDAGGSGDGARSVASKTTASGTAAAVSSTKPEVCEECLVIGAQRGATFLGR